MQDMVRMAQRSTQLQLAQQQLTSRCLSSCPSRDWLHPCQSPMIIAFLRLQNLITEMIKANPSFKPPADYRPEKKYRKLRIPLEEYPGYNFIGLIIGPRGNTQKRMERVRLVGSQVQGFQGSTLSGRR